MSACGRANPSASSHAAQRGQAMTESVLALLLFIVAFLLILQFADNLRAKLLCEYAAGRCARAATIGLNDYMLTKTARLATMSAAGPCRTQSDSGGTLSARALITRADAYLETTYDAQARPILDFDYWADGRTQASAVRAGSKIVATVSQRRPQFFSWARFFAGDADPDAAPDDARLQGTAEIEAHYPDWLQ